MKLIATSFLAAVLLLCTGSAARAESPVGLTIRVYTSSKIDSHTLEMARREAEPVLRETGVDVTFRFCGGIRLPGAGVDACDDALKPSEVVVRVIDAPVFSTTLHPDAYGVTYVVEETNRGWLATLFADRVGVAAVRVGLDPGVLLGRVMAHEVGHLLLGSGYHGDAGVMRAEWPDEILTRRNEQEWRFSPLEAVAMQRALVTSTR